MVASSLDKRGLKRICLSCSTRFYDFNKRPVVCPNCSAEFTGDVKIRARRARPANDDDGVVKASPLAEEAEIEITKDDEPGEEAEADTVSLDEVEEEDAADVEDETLDADLDLDEEDDLDDDDDDDDDDDEEADDDAE